MNIVAAGVIYQNPPRYEDVDVEPLEREFILSKGNRLKIYYDDYHREIKYEIYHPTGERSRVLQFSTRGELDGTCVIYAKNGKPLVERTMKNGVLQHLTCYDSFGNKVYNGDMRANREYISEKYNYRTNKIKHTVILNGFLRSYGYVLE